MMDRTWETILVDGNILFAEHSGNNEFYFCIMSDYTGEILFEEHNVQAKLWREMVRDPDSWAVSSFKYQAEKLRYHEYANRHAEYERKAKQHYSPLESRKNQVISDLASLMASMQNFNEKLPR